MTSLGKRMALHPLSRKIISAGSLFGSVEGLTMLCSVVRNKLIALWIGAAGVGLFGFLSVAVDLISTFCQVGLRNSAVQYISEHHGEQQTRAMQLVSRMGHRMGLIGCVVTMALSPWLSTLVTGDSSAAWMFCLLSIAVYMAITLASRYAILQSAGRLGSIARTSLYASLVSLLFTIPILYFIRNSTGILLILLVYWTVITLVIYIGRYKLPRAESYSLKDDIRQSVSMLRFGFYLSVAACATWAASFAVMSLIRYFGSETAVGLYQSGYTISVRYVGIVFIALSMEYFPRMSRASTGGARRLTILLRHQLKIVLWIVVPMAVTLVLLAPYLVRLLYADEFLPVVPMVVYAAPGIVMRSLSFCIAFVILACGRGKIYLATELASAVICVALNTVCYVYWGMAGLGISFTLYYTAYSAIVWVAVRRLLKVSPGVKTLVWGSVGFAIVSFVVLLLG